MKNKRQILKIVQSILSAKDKGKSNGEGRSQQSTVAQRDDKGDAPDALTVSDLHVLTLCRLWGGMGYIHRVKIIGRKHGFDGIDYNSSSESDSGIIIKHVTPPKQSRRSFGDQRKAVSYQVEANFYDQVAEQLVKGSKVDLPYPLLVQHGPADGEIMIAMTYLEGDGFDGDDQEQVKAVLAWMANFHAASWGGASIDTLVKRASLHETGSYWYLETRPSEHDSMPRHGWEGRLKRAARAIDGCMKRDPMQCLIHGDSKGANILIRQGCAASSAPKDSSHDGQPAVTASMYDFQYCGKGPPTRDLAYFLCSSVSPKHEVEYVAFYHERLCANLSESGIVDSDGSYGDGGRDMAAPPPTLEHLKASLELAFCDYCRFMSGWGYWGFDIKDRVRGFLDQLDGGSDLGSEEAYDAAIRKLLW